MKRILYLLPIVSFCFLVQCKTAKTGSSTTSATTSVAAITKEGFITCFENGLSAGGQPVWCEASAILYDGKQVIFANDKDMPDKRSSVFYWPFKNGFADTMQAVQYLQNPILKNGRKFEDFAMTPDGRIVFLSTGFDRVKPDNAEWNAYNTIFYWQTGNEKEPSLLRENSTDSSSVFLRGRISKALASPEFPNGMPYFKIEGLAATNDMLYFGIREEGKKFDDFKYKIKVLTAPFHIVNGAVQLGTEFKVLADIDSASLPGLKQPMGISSIEYDRFNKRFLILTSYENGENLGGYLWTATQSELENNKITLVKDPNGNPLSFTHKSEDLTVVNRKKIIVIHDDDRVKTKVGNQVRQPNQAAYSIVEFQ